MQIQILEARCLMTAAVVDGVLTVTGDDGDNLVQFSLSASKDTIVLTERADTTAAPAAADVEAATTLTRRQRRRLARQARRAARAAAAGRSNNPVQPAVTESLQLTVTEFNIAEHGITSILVNAGAGNDTVKFCGCVELPATVNAGAGDDRVKLGGGAATVNGGDGNDVILGGMEPDTLNGDAGDDQISCVGGGVDVVNGGSHGEEGDRAVVNSGITADYYRTGDSGDVAMIGPDVVNDVESFAIPLETFGWRADLADPLMGPWVFRRFTAEEAAASNAGAPFGTALTGPWADVFEMP